MMRLPNRGLVGSLVVLAVAGVVAGRAARSQPAARAVAPAVAPERIDCQITGAEGPLAEARVTVVLSVSEKDDAVPSGTGDPARRLLIRGQNRTLHEAAYTSDAQGRYSIRIPAEIARTPDVWLAVTVSHPAHLTRTIGPLPASDFDRQNLRDEEGVWRGLTRQAILNTVLRKANPLTGRVLLPDGSPAVGARVVTRSKHRPYAWKFLSADDYIASDTATTDEQGNFSLVVDDRATLTVTLAGQAPLIVDDLADVNPTFRLPPGIRPRGRVLTADGKPIARAIVIASRDAAYNEINMPLHFRLMCAANEAGEFELPPLPAGAYRFDVHMRLADAGRVADFNTGRLDPDLSQMPLEALEDVIAERQQTLELANAAPRIDFRAIETVSIAARIFFPQGRDPDGSPVDFSVEGKLNGKRWSGISATADKEGNARLIVPRGIDDLKIDTGLALLRRAKNGTFEMGTTIHLGTVTSNVSDILVVRPRLSKLKVHVTVSDALDRQLATSQAHLYINASHVREGYLHNLPTKQVVHLQGGMQTGSYEYRGLALPDEPIVLRISKKVDGKETVVHEQRLTLAVGEEKLVEVDLRGR